MVEEETPRITSTVGVEAKLPPLKRVGYVETIKKEKIEVNIRTYKVDEEVKSYWIYINRLPIVAIQATKIYTTSTGLWFYKHDELVAHLPLDEMEAST